MISKKQKILVTGASGLVGSYFCRLLSCHTETYDIYVTRHTDPSSIGKSIPIDLHDLDRFYDVIVKINPDVVVNLAAMTNVDACEINREEADKINHHTVRMIARYLESNKTSFLLQVSTDYVFDGQAGKYQESSDTSSVNWYGRTKLLAEEELQRCNSSNYCIARTSTPFGIHKKKQSFPIFVMNNLSSKQVVKALVDQITSPTYSANLAEMMLEVIGRRISGIMHLSGSSQLSRYDQAIKIATQFDLDQSLIKPTYMNELEWKAIRPRDSSLNTDKAMSMLAAKPMSFQEALTLFARDLRSS